METTTVEPTQELAPEIGGTPTPEETEAQTDLAASAETTPDVSADTAGDKPAVEATKGGEAEAYTPNFEFTANEEKKEFDEWARGLVKDKETEAKFRDMFEKAYGLDSVKKNRNELRDELKTARSERKDLDERLDTISTYVANKDFRSFFEALQIPKDDILKYAIDELKYNELSPEQRQAVDAQRAQQTRLSQLEVQNQTLAQQYESTVRQQKESELGSELSRQEVTQVAQTYDARVGRPGAFRDEVIKRGAYYESTMGQTITATQAVNEVMQLIGAQASTETQTVTTPQQPATQSQVVAQQQKKPVIPNVQGQSGVSPHRKTPTSLDDLKRMRDQMMSQG